MSEINTLSNSLEKTIKDSNLLVVTTNLAESLSDSILDEGLFRDIPILSSLLGLIKTSINVSDRLFLKKTIYFLTELSSINPESRKKQIEKIENSKSYQVKFGEKLLYIIDKCDDHVSAKYISKLFCAFLNEKLTYQEFLRSSTIVQNVFIDDLLKLCETKSEFIEKEIQPDEALTDYYVSLINAGILAMGTNSITISDQWDWKRGDEKYIVEGDGMLIYFTEIGYKIKTIFKNK